MTLRYVPVTACFILSMILPLMPVHAQTATAIPENPAAVAIFQDGLAAYEGARYSDAYDLFSRVFVEFNFNTHTTAAMLMAGKALYADGACERSANLLTRLVEDYPDSRYVETALQTRSLAEIYLERSRRVDEDLISIGVVLPEEQIDFVRPMVSAAMQAVDVYNAGNPVYPVRLLVRNSGGNGGDAARAVERLIDEESVDAILGPLYSEEARGAARVADRAGVPMLVPLATDAAVSERMNTILQANPTFDMRGRLMGRYAVERLRLGRLGVIVQEETDAERFADGFISEALANGAEVRMDFRLPDKRAWYQLADYFDADSLTYVDALYVPVTGGGAQGLIQTLLDGIDAINPEIQLLGNGEWNGLPKTEQAERHLALFTSNFETDTTDGAFRAFADRYEAAFGENPDEMAVVGYDAMQFVIEAIRSIDSRTGMLEALRNADRFEGIGRIIDFRSGNVNQTISFRSYRNGEVVLRD